MARRYESALEQAYARANRASRRANDARGKAMARPRDAALHLRAAKLFRVTGRLYMKAAKQDPRPDPWAKESAKAAFATAIFHERYARKIEHGEMGAPGSHHEMLRLVRHRRAPARDPRAMKMTWHTYAGGTGAHHGSSYDARGDFGEYHINPPSRRGGGYHLRWANTRSLEGHGGHGGLWHDIGSFRSPASAKKAAREHAARLTRGPYSRDLFRDRVPRRSSRDPSSYVMEILSVSHPPGGTKYLVRVPDVKNRRGYDLVDVIVHHNGARSIKSASRSTITPTKASSFVTRYLTADTIEKERMRGHLRDAHRRGRQSRSQPRRRLS